MAQRDPELRVAVPDDAEQIYAVHLSNGAVDEWKDVSECREQIERMGLLDAASVVAEEAGQIVGELKVWWGDDVPELGTTLDISTLYVHRDWQRRGIGRELLLWAVESAGHLGCNHVTVWPNDDSAPFYRRCGFEDGLELRECCVARPVT